MDGMSFEKFFNSLKVGMKVKSCLDGYDISDLWYTGVIHHIDRYSHHVDIARDNYEDGGAGLDNSWNTILDKENYKSLILLQPPVGEWDG